MKKVNKCKLSPRLPALFGTLDFPDSDLMRLFSHWTCVWVDAAMPAALLVTDHSVLCAIARNKNSTQSWTELAKLGYNKLFQNFNDFEASCIMLNALTGDLRYLKWIKLVSKQQKKKQTLQLLQVGGLYQNTKTKQFYELQELGVHTETQELLCSYACVDTDGYASDLSSRWFSPITRFAGKRKNGQWYFKLTTREAYRARKFDLS